MRVETAKKECRKWERVEEGECFVYCNELYMKMDNADGYNAVRLTDGELESFDDDDSVELVSAHIVIE